MTVYRVPQVDTAEAQKQREAALPALAECPGTCQDDCCMGEEVAQACRRRDGHKGSCSCGGY